MHGHAVGNLIIGQRTFVFELLAAKDEALFGHRDVFALFDHLLDVIDGILRLHLETNALVAQRTYKDLLHNTKETDKRIKTGNGNKNGKKRHENHDDVNQPLDFSCVLRVLVFFLTLFHFSQVSRSSLFIMVTAIVHGMNNNSNAPSSSTVVIPWGSAYQENKNGVAHYQTSHTNWSPSQLTPGLPNQANNMGEEKEPQLLAACSNGVILADPVYHVRSHESDRLS